MNIVSLPASDRVPRSSGIARSFGCGRDEAALEDGLDLGREEQPIAIARPVERLDPEAIASDEQTAPARIPDREREHAAEVVDAVVAPLLVGVDDALGVRLRAIDVAEAFELAPEVAVVVNLAVEADPDRLVFVGERLLAGGEIHDAQTAMAEGRLLVDEKPGSVRTAMHEDVAHRHHAVAVFWRRAHWPRRFLRFHTCRFGS